MPTEADTCRKLVVPKLQAAGWDNDPFSVAEQRTITDGRIVPVGKSFIRRPPKRVDYLLRYRRDFLLAVIAVLLVGFSALSNANTGDLVKGTLFRSADEQQSIKIISADELELTQGRGGPHLVCK